MVDPRTVGQPRYMAKNPGRYNDSWKLSCKRCGEDWGEHYDEDPIATCYESGDARFV